MNTREDIGYGAAPRGTIPPCCKHGFSEEGFVHQWLAHFDDVSKSRVLLLADDGTQPWKRWLEAALAAEGAA